MGTGASGNSLRGPRDRDRLKARLKGTRRARGRRIEIEGLEARTLLATIPAATPTVAPQNLSTMFGNAGGVNAATSGAVVAVNPTDPTKLVAAWVDDDPAMLGLTNNEIQVVLEAAYSVDSGRSWLPLLAEPTQSAVISAPLLLDPSTSGPTVPYKYQTDPSIGFDRNGNFYILDEYHNGLTAATSSSGAVVLQKFNFNGSTPATQTFPTNVQSPNPYGFGGFFGSGNVKVIYQWLNSGSNDAAINATMEVDDNLATIPTGVTSQADPFSGNVYVGWTSVDINTAIPITPFNPNRTKLVVSSDGGNNFSPVTIANVNNASFTDDGNFTTEHDTTPAITVSQGRLPSESGQNGDPGIPGGQVAVTWDDFGHGQLLANTVSAGRDYSFGGQAGTIPFGTYLTGGTAWANTVSIPNPTGTATLPPLSTLAVTVNIVDSNDANLGLVLVAPSGDRFTLLLNQIIDTSPTQTVTLQGQGISGGNLGVQTYTNNNILTYAMGTTFDDDATRSIFDPTPNGTNAISGPAIGNYQPEFGSLKAFLAQELSKGINGTWNLITLDSNTSAPTSPNFIINWSLNFGRGLTADNDVVLPGTSTNGLRGVVPVTAADPRAGGVTVPSSPIQIGPGVVMAQDNTIGAYSQHQGRIYAAWVGYWNVTVNNIKNPASNTDIFLSYSDDGGRTWSAPIEVNDDAGTTDGASGAGENLNTPDIFTGRSQYQPEIAVDQATGTVVLSWRDARDDSANTLVSTYITASIDGGNTFSRQTYANPSSTAVDAINTQKVVLHPQGDNGTSGDNSTNGDYGLGTAMGLAVYDGQVYPVWAGNLDRASIVNNALAGNALSLYAASMAIAAGPRIINSSQGPIPLSPSGLDGYQQAQQNGQLSFTVTFDRPIDPPGATASFTPNDVQVFYQDTNFGDPSIPLQVLSVNPVTSSGVGPLGKFGYTTFKVTFSTAGITNFTGTYSYLITPDDGSGNPIQQAIPSYVDKDVQQSLIGPVPSTQVPLRLPTSGTGGTGTNDDVTTSTITLGGFNNQVITGVTLNLSLTHQRASDLTITLTAPDGKTGTVYRGATNGPVTLNNQAFTVNGLAGSRVNGVYTLTIVDNATNNTGTLTGWSVSIASLLPTYVFQTGAPMDQNADGTADENPLTTPGGFTGTTPGDVYAIPTPQLTAPTTFKTVKDILTPPFNQNTVPLIVTGPQVLSTQAVGASGQASTGTDNLLKDDKASQFNVTLDRPVQVSTFDASQVLSIMGPIGPITAPQSFTSPSLGQTIPAANAGIAGSLDSTLSINSGGTLLIGDISVTINIASQADSALTAVLVAVAPNGVTRATIPLFSGVGGTGANFINTTFSDSATKSITQGSAPFTGTFLPAYDLTSPRLSSLLGQAADGTWHLQVTNTRTGVASTLDSWSLTITPKITVTPVNPTTVTVNGVQQTVATTFAIHFPQQQLSGTYTIQLGPTIQDQFGDGMDVNGSAGLDVLRGFSQNGPTTTARYTAADLPKAISGSASTSSSIVVPDSFIIKGDKTAAGQSVMQVQLNITYPNDPDLTATLYHYDKNGNLLGQAILFSGVGTGVKTANFTNTVFDDNSATPIQNGSAPFFAIYDPQQSLATVFAPTANGQQGMNVQGTWTLAISGGSTTGTLSSWALSFQKSLPTSGLGEVGSDNATVGFRLFNMGQTDALSSQQWTSVGGASSTQESGQVNAIAVDPSDPSGNTVYVGGASGGVWKTTDFLTTKPGGPTWIPLTNFGPSTAVNISSIAIYPRNHDVNQSIIIAGTGGFSSGQHAAFAPGVGFLMSSDGGVTWNLFDSTNNVTAFSPVVGDTSNLLPINSAARDRLFVGTIIYQLAVDPQLNPNGQMIIYAAVTNPADQTGGSTGGIWRSQDSGQTWTRILAGNATSVILNRDSGIVLDPATGTDIQGNLQIVYAGLEGSGSGVYMSTNQGQSWSIMNGGVGNPLIVDVYDGKNVNPASNPNPNGAGGRIVLASPAPTGNAVQDAIYAGWLYAAVVNTDGSFHGLYMTKDFGENWTKIRIPTPPPLTAGGIYHQAIPTDDIAGSLPDYAITDDTQGNLDLALTVDPTNPNITYLGGFGGNGYNSDTGLIRIDATHLHDAHNLQSALSDILGFGKTLRAANTGASNFDTILGTPVWEVPPGFTLDPTPYLNFIRNPLEPFLQDATLYVYDYANFWNDGGGATWTPMDVPLTSVFTPPGSNSEISGTGYQIALSEVDPTTGLPRLIVGNLTGVYSGLDNKGVFEATIGDSNAAPSVDRNGNLSLGQFYYGAVQPSSAAAQVAGSLFYAGAQNIGGQASDPSLLADGNLRWSALGATVPNYTPSNQVDFFGGTFYIASGTSVDQQGLGTVYQYYSPGQGGEDTNFVMVNGVGRTFNLLQQSNGLPTPDPQWPRTSWANLVVNPVNGQDLLVSSSVGRIFASTDQGKTWFEIGTPGTFGNPPFTSFALAYGAPDPGAPSGVGNLGNFIYVGTATGRAFVSRDAGGHWTEISTGLDLTSPVEQIITDPARGSHDAYAVTSNGVYYLANSITSSSNPTPTWVNITGNIKSLAYSIFGQAYNPTTDPNASPYQLATAFNSIAANWNYTIPNNPANLSQGYHPVLYVAANSGVYMSADNGKTWTLFPTSTFGATAEGGNLPHVSVTDLSLSQGNIAVATGMPDLAGPYNPSKPTATPDPDLLMASTYGEGAFTINLAPMLFPSTVSVASANTSGTAADGTTIVTTAKPTIDGLSEITGFGNATWVTILDTTPGDLVNGKPVIIGGFDPSTVQLGKSIAITSGNATDAFGNFAIPITSAFGSNGLKTIEVYTTDDAGSKSNPVTLTFTLQATDLKVTPPTSPPAAPTIALASPTNTVGGVPVTNLTDPLFSGTTLNGTFITVTETWQDGPAGTQPITVTLPGSAVNTDGTFNFTFQDFTDPTTGGPVESGTFLVSAQATWTNPSFPQGLSLPSNVVKFQIDNTPAKAVKDFRLSPASDTGIAGDNVTSQRKPVFIGTTDPGNIVELFVNGQTAVQATATASPTTSTDANGAVYNFSIQLPYSLTNGQTSLYVEVINAAGNISDHSNSAGVVLASTAADYNGGAPSDPALFTRNGTSNQLQWLVQTPSGSAPPWFGPNGVLYTPSTVFTGTLTAGSAVVTGLGNTKGLSVGENVAGTGIPAGTTIKAINNSTSITLSANATAGGSKSLTFTGPANVVPFEGDFDGDGVTDLAYYNIANATWTVIESSNYSVQGATTFSMGTAGSSLPVAGHFDPNAPSEEAVFTVNAQGQGVWTIASVLTGIRTFTFGQAGDVPLAGAFDALGYDEAAVYRPSTGQFLVLNPTTKATETLTIPGIAASPDLVPVPGQYDNAYYFSQASNPTLPFFGRTEAAVFDPKTGAFTILGPKGEYSASGVYTVPGFQPGDIPAPADYGQNGVGLGYDQVVIYRPSTGQFIQGTKSGLTTLATLGQSGDIPITAPLVYRVPSNTTLISTPTPTPTTPTPTPTTPTPTPTTPTPTSTTPTPTSTTPTPTSTSQVTVSSVQLITNRKHRVTEILVGFSGALNAAEAQALGIYHLTVAGKHGSFTAKNARSIKLKGAVYNPANDTVALFTRKPFALKKPVQLLVDGTPPSGLEDSQGRPIDGGRNPVAVLSRGGVSLAAMAFGPTGAANGGVSAATVDALMELNALAGVAPSQRPGRKRQ